ncbi:MAG: multiprotein-bridging factor 1 family protein [Candidatus Cryptobacteroides sp.]
MMKQKRTDISRQIIAAEQIDAAIKKRGLTRKQFAELMNRNPSEVTKWLSGKHNFTIALLQEISNTLEVQVTGVEDVRELVAGYGNDNEGQTMSDSAVAYGSDTILSNKICMRSAELGISVKAYLERLVDDDIRKSKRLPKIELPIAFDDVVEKYAGIISCPSQEDLDNDVRLERIWNR